MGRKRRCAPLAPITTGVRISRTHMNWLSISEIGNSRVVRSMLILMILTPFLAKSFCSVNSVDLTFFKTDQAIFLSLPFSWQVFFFCALSFTIANVIFLGKCPSLIKKYNNYADFEGKDNSLYLLVDHFNKHVTETMVGDNYLEIGVIVSKYSPSVGVTREWTSDDTSEVNWKKGIDSLKHAAVADKADLFASLRIVLSKLYPGWAKICLGFYALGFLGIAVVIFQNVIYVYDQLQF